MDIDIKALMAKLDDLNRRMAEAETAIDSAKHMVEQNRVTIQKANARIVDLDINAQVQGQQLRDLMERTHKQNERLERHIEDMLKTLNRIDVTVQAGEEIRAKDEKEKAQEKNRLTKIIVAVVTGTATVTAAIIAKFNVLKGFFS